MKPQPYARTLAIVAGALLILAALSVWPYAFYQFLRWVVAIAAVVNAYHAYDKKQMNWVGVFAVVAIVFNPLAPLFLTKSVWAVFDLVAAAIMFGSLNVLHRKGKGC